MQGKGVKYSQHQKDTVHTIVADQFGHGVERMTCTHQEDITRKLVRLDVILPEVCCQLLTLLSCLVCGGRSIFDLGCLVRIEIRKGGVRSHRDKFWDVDVDHTKVVSYCPLDVRLCAVNLWVKKLGVLEFLFEYERQEAMKETGSPEGGKVWVRWWRQYLLAMYHESFAEL